MLIVIINQISLLKLNEFIPSIPEDTTLVRTRNPDEVTTGSQPIATIPEHPTLLEPTTPPVDATTEANVATVPERATLEPTTTPVDATTNSTIATIPEQATLEPTTTPVDATTDSTIVTVPEQATLLEPTTTPVDETTDSTIDTVSEQATLEPTTIPDDATMESERRSTEQKPMNVVLFYADDWTFHTLGAMGNKYVKTPYLDELASQGVLFTHNCVVTSICMQSRATLYTGQYSSRHRTYFIWRNVTMYEEGRWNNTLYPLMLNHGYHVGFFGKYHHLEPPPGPTFSKWSSTGLSHYVDCHGTHKHVTQCNEDDGVEFLTNRPQDQPFFLTLSFFATHAEDGNPENYIPMETSKDLYVEEPVPIPKTLTEEHWKKLPPFFDDRNVGRGRFRGRYDTPELYQENMKKLYRMATEVDAACGKIMTMLKEQGVMDNTMIIFTTDNGNFHGEHGLSEKWYAYEESIRVPLIIRDPRVPVNMIGTENSEFTLNIDLAPTILMAAGIVPPEGMQGRDMSPLYINHAEASATWRKEFLYEYWGDIDEIPNSVALVGQGFKFIYWTDHNYTQYFDLEKDPLEEYDIFSSADKTLLLNAQRRMDELRISAEAGLPQ
jgi:arylsulfatase